MNRSTRRAAVAAHAAASATAAGPASIDRLADELSRRLRQSLLDLVLRLGESGAGPGPGNDTARAALTVPPAQPPLAPALLAQATPGDALQQRRMREIYERCLAHYRGVVVPALRSSPPPANGAPTLDDVGAAAAHFVAANFVVLHGVQATPQRLAALERQLGAIVRATSAWSEAPVRERQIYFEKLAVLGVLVHETARQAQAQGPAARAHVQQAARNYLGELLGLDPAGLTLGDQGLALAEPAPGEAAEAALAG